MVNHTANIQLIVDRTTRHHKKPEGYEIAAASIALDKASDTPTIIHSAAELGGLFRLSTLTG